MARTWKKLSDVAEAALTPMLRQYIAAKAEAGNSLLFFRMGDFYELFFEDAVEAAELLGLTLTTRDGTNTDTPIPMAGVPVRAAESYVARAIKAGRTVTICDQIEDPREAKGVVKRAVVRTVTPGTITEPDLLEERTNNYLAALHLHGAKAGLAFVDVTTGEFLAAQIDQHAPRVVFDELTRMAPAEVLIADDTDPSFLGELAARFDGMPLTRIGAAELDAEYARDRLLERFGLGTLKGIGLDRADEALGAAGAVLAYIVRTQRDAVPHLRLPRRYHPARFVVLDGHTQRNLELVESLADKRKRGSLLGVLDRTRTSMGARKLRSWVLHPLLDVDEIRGRLGAVEALYDQAAFRLELHEALRGIADLERLMGRITARTGNARDVRALGDSLAVVPALRALLTQVSSPLIAAVHDQLDPLEDVTGAIAAALVEQPPLAITEGGLIQDGHDPELDRLRDLVRGGRDWIATLQREESARTGIPNLKIGYNKVFGYYIEISKSHADKVPDDYIRKQTLVNAERYVTPGLKEREEDIVTAQDKMQRLEYDLFSALRDRVAAQASRIAETADAIATADVLLALAEVAAAKNYTKPDIDGSNELHITDGRHPVVEDLMNRGEFVPNDTHLEPGTASLHIVTGPNMAGKSTYLRQVALISLMAQIGSFVPAASARLGLVDRIFTRVGASDNLVRGESTFMVEMIETAAILNTATERSLLVLDEIGRGTSTYDGISIAWAVAEFIHDRIQAKTLFATHFHELTELANKLEAAKNVNVAVREFQGKVIFLYRIVDGGADHSYGIQVAKLAGLPRAVIARAREILTALESGDTAALGLPQQLYLFGPAPQAPAPAPSAVEDELRAIDPDDLTPKEAHELLYRLRALLDNAED